MGAADAYHRTLVSGLEISTGKPDGEDLELLNIGTLTGIALKRSTGRKVLVTNQHIMAGSDDGAYRDADGTEEMYQPDLEEDRRIGTRIDPYAWRNVNRIDLATCELDPDSGREIDHALHGSPRHTDRKVVTPSFYPYVGTWLTMIGAKGGEGRVRVAEVGAEQEIGGKFFTNLVLLNTGRRPVVHGDSGAGCYFDNGNGEFQLVCILFAGRGQSGQYGWAFPATTAERLMGLRFGNTPPAANAGPDQTVTTGDLVTLDGRRSRDPDRDPLTYKWRQVPGVGGTSIGTGPNPLTSESTYTFEAPEGPVALSFKLTVTDSFGESASDVMNVTVKPVEIWGEWMDTDPVEYRRDGLTRERKQIRTSNLGNVEVTWIHDPEPAEPLPPTPGNWVDTDPVVYRGDGLTRERKQTRTWSDGRVEIRWVSDPEPVTPPPDPDPPPTPGPWMDTDPVEYRYEGLAREKKQTRTWSDGRVEVRWNPAPVTPDPDPDPDPSPDPDPDPPPTAGEWTNTEEYRGEGHDRERKQTRTWSDGRVEERWIPDPVPEPEPVPDPEIWGPWVDTGRTRGQFAEQEKEQISTSNFGNTKTRWISDPVPEPEPVPDPEIWGPWVDTGRIRGQFAEQEKEQISTSNFGNTKTRWISDPVPEPEPVPDPEIWGPWVDTGRTRGQFAEQEKEQISTSNFGNTKTRWISDPVPEPEPEPVPDPEIWGSWVDTGRTRGQFAEQEKEQISTSSFGNTKTRWISDPVPEPVPDPEIWGPWVDTGRTRGTLANREKEQIRTSNFGSTQTRWVSDPEPEVWGNWTDTGDYQGELDLREKKQRRTSNYGREDIRWVSDPEPERWGNWVDTGRTRYLIDLNETEKEQSRTSNYGNTQTRWVFSHFG